MVVNDFEDCELFEDSLFKELSTNILNEKDNYSKATLCFFGPVYVSIYQI